jgi:hypothetical protein
MYLIMSKCTFLHAGINTSTGKSVVCFKANDFWNCDRNYFIIIAVTELFSIGYKKRKPCGIKDTNLKNKDTKIRFISNSCYPLL